MARLCFVSLPIGNLGDISQRALTALKEGKIFIAEDTRSFGHLLNLLGISLSGKSLLSFHEHSKDKIVMLVEKILLEDIVYLVSDAGSPVISDPAFPLVREALERGITLETLPGPCSAIAALEVSGLPPYPFHFHGFFPRGKTERERIIDWAKSITGTHVFFESPERIVDALDDLVERLTPETPVVVARELTKKFETVHRFSAREWAGIKNSIHSKGEFIFLFHSSTEQSGALSDPKIKEAAAELLEKGTKVKSVAKLLALILGRSAKEVYKELVESDGNDRES
jgi:16S rRNA (cytidine1402-2'-O)-methyltransferase